MRELIAVAQKEFHMGNVFDARLDSKKEYLLVTSRVGQVIVFFPREFPWDPPLFYSPGFHIKYRGTPSYKGGRSLYNYLFRALSGLEGAKSSGRSENDLLIVERAETANRDEIRAGLVAGGGEKDKAVDILSGRAVPDDPPGVEESIVQEQVAELKEEYDTTYQDATEENQLGTVTIRAIPDVGEIRFLIPMGYPNLRPDVSTSTHLAEVSDEWDGTMSLLELVEDIVSAIRDDTEGSHVKLQQRIL